MSENGVYKTDLNWQESFTLEFIGKEN
jgi:hypothetical protein